MAYWYLRLKEDGMIAGDDIDNKEVVNAIRWFFDIEKVEVVGRQWLLDLRN